MRHRNSAYSYCFLGRIGTSAETGERNYTRVGCDIGRPSSCLAADGRIGGADSVRVTTDAFGAEEYGWPVGDGLEP